MLNLAKKAPHCGSLWPVSMVYTDDRWINNKINGQKKMFNKSNDLDTKLMKSLKSEMRVNQGNVWKFCHYSDCCIKLTYGMETISLEWSWMLSSFIDLGESPISIV